MPSVYCAKALAALGRSCLYAGFISVEDIPLELLQSVEKQQGLHVVIPKPWVAVYSIFSSCSASVFTCGL